MSAELGGGGNSLAGDQRAAGAPSPGAAYAPSPNTSSLALNRANQMRIQTLLRQLLANRPSGGGAEHARLDTLRVLRKTLREIDYQLSWLTQVDFLETLERILVTHDESIESIKRDSNVNNKSAQEQEEEEGEGREQPASWRLVHDTTQLLLEALPRLCHEIAFEIVESIVPICVENLGHLRSEVRRASLLLLNMLLREMPHNFQPLLRLFIDFGLTNYRNQRAQRGAILSLPLIMNQTLVDREDLTPLIRCLSALLIDDSEKNEQLFYSLYLALQRLHMMMGDRRFNDLMAQCEPEALQLYRQAASRHNSLAAGSGGGGSRRASCASGNSNTQQNRDNEIGQDNEEKQQPPLPQDGDTKTPMSPTSSASSSPVSVLRRDESSGAPIEQQQQARHQQHVTFMNDAPNEQVAQPPPQQRPSSAGELGDEGDQEPANERATSVTSNSSASLSGRHSNSIGRMASGASSSSLETSLTGSGLNQSGRPSAGKEQRGQWSSDVSSTCSSDAHLVNPAHYMTAAALRGKPLENYDQIHHVDHSNVTSLAINDFGPICNTPTVEVNPKLNYLTTIKSLGTTTTGNGGGGGGGFMMQAESPMSPSGLILNDETLTRHELKFGILPRQLIAVSLNGSLRSADRYEAIQELMCIVRESPVNHLAILMTYFDSFLEQFISRLILPGGAMGPSQVATGGSVTSNNNINQQQTRGQQVNSQTSLKLSLSAIDMLETIVVKTKVSTMQYIRPIVSLLLRSLGAQDSNSNANYSTTTAAYSSSSSSTLSLMRENACRVLHKLMAYLPPQHVIDAIFEHKHHKSALVREEAINRVTAAILDYDRNEFNLTKLCYHVLPMLADSDQNVRMASLECIATLAHILGPDRIGSLLTAAEAVQTNCDYDGLLDAIHARLMRHALPRLCQPNMLVKHLIRPFLYGASAQLAAEQQQQLEDEPAPSTGGKQRQLVAADIRWVLEAPSSHQHASAGLFYKPHAHTHQPEVGRKQQQQRSKQRRRPQLERQQHHRLGVYSPPSLAERRRRGSMGFIGHLADSNSPSTTSSDEEVEHQHHAHEHHHDRHHQATIANEGEHQQQATTTACKRASCSSEQRATTRRSSSREVQVKQQQEAEIEALVAGGNQSENEVVEGAISEQQTAINSGGRRKSCNQPNNGLELEDETQMPAANCGSSRRASSKTTNLTSQKQTSGDRPTLGGLQDKQISMEKGQQQQQMAPLGRDARRQSGVKDLELRKNSSGQRRGESIEAPREPVGFQQKRSNSQDSLSSTDTNKLLFQYYLGKFKQSLAASPVGQANYQQHALLPSDSIIYADDVDQVYASSRHQSRYQQTSFEFPSSHRRQHDAELRDLQPAGTRIGPRPQKQQQQQSGKDLSESQPGQQQRARVSSSNSKQSSLSLRDGEQAAAAAAPSMSTQRQHEQHERQLQVARNQSSNSSQLRRQPSMADDQRDETDPNEKRKSLASERELVSESASVSHHSSKQQQQLRKKSVNLSNDSSRALPTSRSVSKQLATPPPVQQQQQQQSPAASGLQRNESDTTASSMSTSEIVPLSTAHEQQGDVTNHPEQAAQEVCLPPSPNLSSSERLRRSSTRNQLIEGDSRPPQVTSASDETSRQMRRRASRSQPPPMERHHEQQQQNEAPVGSGKAHSAARKSRDEGARCEQQPEMSETAAAAGEQKQRHRLSQLSGESHVGGNHQKPAPGPVRPMGSTSGRRAVSVSPSLSNSVNIRHILENVAELEGKFAEPSLAFKVAMDALDSPCWSTKVEGVLALIRLAAFHQPQLLQPSSRLHEIVLKLTHEIGNLRSTVARSAIFALGDLSVKLKRLIEPEMDLIVRALLQKSNENTAFIRDDIRKALGELVDNLTPWRLASSLIAHGAAHKSANVRRMASQFVAQLVAERLGPAKCLVGSREISATLLPATCKFAQDNSPQTRYYGRLILSKLMHHTSFDRLLRRHLPSNLYRSSVGVLESIKRRGPGEIPPFD